MADASKKLILIIDDEEDVRMLLASRLVSDGFEVLDTGDGDEGLSLAQQRPPHLIVLDVLMPSMNGHQFWSRLKRNPALKEIPVLIFSGQLQATDHFWGHLINPKDYILKTQPAQLVARIKERLA